ncbi:MAG TPA: sugar phosphate isomerase/epimerase family protein [bacterium]|nr:sugar phosphate isomerase/epimerase family protein [bacterium]HPJ71437.1 sugar phosphate isomerase/epimerase family protein [bacterium]
MAKPLSISTVWNSWRHPGARSMVAELAGLGFERIELNAFMPSRMVEEVHDMVREGAVEVSSLHNYCPAPPLRRREEPPSLSAPAERERAWAVRNTLNTIDRARELGASAVVLHLGAVPPSRSARDLYAWIDAGGGGTPRYLRKKEKILLAREKRKSPYLRAVRKSLEELVPAARSAGVRLGMETRYFPWEIPNLDEIEELWDGLDSRALGYWHDVGHAAVRENAGLERALSYLERYGSRLVGLHIHDVEGTADHRVPGSGSVDFAVLRSAVGQEGVVPVIEVHPRETAAGIAGAREMLSA